MDDSLPDGLWPENIIHFENMGNTVQDLCNEELHGKGSYTLEDSVQSFACNSGSNSRSKEGSEDDIGEGERQRIVARKGWQLRKESSGKGGDYVDDDSGEDKELDDWRDDMKAHEREKVKQKEKKRESIKIEDKKSTTGQTPSIQDQERPAATLHGQTMKSSGKGNEVGSTVSVDLVGGFG
ncbi:unnamed protein product, partial [Sphagnum compactum]